ncbi:MAG: hypothetical protein AB4062_13180 [Crocosphaera sp.]
MRYSNSPQNRMIACLTIALREQSSKLSDHLSNCCATVTVLKIERSPDRINCGQGI